MMTVIDLIIHLDGTIEEVERVLTPQEEDWAINGEPPPDPDEDITAEEAIYILMGGADSDEG